MTTEFTSGTVVSKPLPILNTTESKDEFRIWIGNLDMKWNEYILLQLLKKYETLKSFDIIRNKAGLHKGQSKGYGFASFSSKQPAAQAIKELHNSIVSGRKISVKWATEFTVKQQAPSVLTTPLVVEKSKKTKKESAIEAIERKLKEMEESSVDDDDGDNKMHPLLQQAQVRRKEDEARKKARERRNHPYSKKKRR